MAFPTSGLVDNQVHKEGNRSFVWDDTLEVWDRAPEAPETISILEASTGLDNVTLGNSTVFPSGHIIKTQIHENSTRTEIANSAATADRNDLWTFTVNKSLATTDLYFTIVLAIHDDWNGFASWHIRKSGGTWRALGGGHNYSIYSATVNLIGSIPAADTVAGDNSIVISWASHIAKPFIVWNPNAIDSVNEQYYPAYSKAISHEIVP